MSLSAPPPKYPLTIWRDATFEKVMIYYAGRDEASGPLDLSGYSAKLVVRAPGHTADIFTLASPDGIRLGGVAGTITISIPASVTTNLVWHSGSYELLLNDGQTVTALLRGPVRIKGI